MGVEDDRRQRDQGWDAGQVRRLRRHAGLSQQALAEQLNARQQTVSEWERGEYEPRGTAARLLTRVAEDVQFPFEAGGGAAGTAQTNQTGAADDGGDGGEDE